MINKNLLLTCFLAITLPACSTSVDKKNEKTITKDFAYYNIPNMPTNEWISENLIIYQERAMQKNATEYDKEAFQAIKTVAHQYTINEIKAKKTENLNMNNKQTLRFGNVGLGGAAQRQPAYIHVLASKFEGNDNSLTQQDNNLKSNNVLKEIVEKGLTSQQSNIGDREKNKAVLTNWGKSSGGYSIYELSRWKRYCINEKMDEADWNFVNKELQADHEIPFKLISNCTPPPFSFEDYNEAWNNYCSNKKLTPTEIKVIGQSFKPKSLKCEIIK